MSGQPTRKHPAAWVPTLYFAEGLPFYAVNFMALAFYQRMGVSNTVITFVVSLLAFPWTLKPLWSPFLEMYKTKKFFVVTLEFIGGLSLVCLALSLNLPGYLRYSIAILAVMGFCSATHDIAADGIYIASLSQKEQSAWAGWQGAFFNLARVFSMGGLIWLTGVLQDHFLRIHYSAPMVHAWMLVFAGLGFLLVAIAAYHAHFLPTGGEERRTETFEAAAKTFWDVVVTFFQKPGVIVFLVFIFLYRLGEGQVIKVGPLFLQADRATGGLGLTLKEFGTIYGLFGSVAYVAGSVLAGYFTAWLGLKRALFPLLCVLTFPMLAYFYLSTALPTNPVLITIAMSIEMFGYGFGFVGVILLMMQEIAPGKYQTAHYAFANSLMNLGVILPGLVSGWIQTRIGYRSFFIWVLISSIPALILSRFVPIRQPGATTESAKAVEA